MLLEEGMGPIICTQPRRLAVATVAKRVAEERGCTLGGEVGYQIGQQKVSSTRYVHKFSSVEVIPASSKSCGNCPTCWIVPAINISKL